MSRTNSSLVPKTCSASLSHTVVAKDAEKLAGGSLILGTVTPANESLHPTAAALRFSGRYVPPAAAASEQFRSATKRSYRLPSEETKPTGTEFYVHLSRVKKVAAVAGVLGGIGGAAFVVFHLVMADKPSLKGVFIFPFALAFAISSMLTGVALLIAPTAFYASEKGQEYLAAIGTTNVKTAQLFS